MTKENNEVQGRLMRDCGHSVSELCWDAEIPNEDVSRILNTYADACRNVFLASAHASLCKVTEVNGSDYDCPDNMVRLIWRGCCPMPGEVLPSLSCALGHYGETELIYKLHPRWRVPIVKVEWKGTLCDMGEDNFKASHILHDVDFDFLQTLPLKVGDLLDKCMNRVPPEKRGATRMELYIESMPEVSLESKGWMIYLKGSWNMGVVVHGYEVSL